MRNAAGMSQEDFGKRAHYSGSQVSAVELGQRPLDEVYLARADEIFETGGLFVAMLELAKRDGEPIWFRPWLEAERNATQLRCFHPTLIPGLLQTEDYARAVIRTDSRLTEEEVEKLVAARMERQAILDREHPPQLTAVIDESALRRFADGCEKVMAEQLMHLVASAERQHVSVHVIPASAGLYVGLDGPLILAHSTEAGWVGHLDDQLGGNVADRTEDVETLLAKWESVRNDALPRRQSLDLIKEIVRPWI
ncbi:helix-turn-helix domain-containing protein [Micromonospora pisi]|nr:helix-turn-helix transcriptional regulator [Micromonospora pisi]